MFVSGMLVSKVGGLLGLVILIFYVVLILVVFDCSMFLL